MSITNEFKKLNVKKKIVSKRPDLDRVKQLLDEKRERGIIPKKDFRVPTLQEAERYGYEKFFIRQ